MTASRSCPICKRDLPAGEEAARFRPFCSRRCADIDLNRWLKGGYAIPAVEFGDESQSEAGGSGENEGEGDAARPVRH